ncbi:hypothetical protein MASR2M74_04580 [Paracoccaceae bacterium]
MTDLSDRQSQETAALVARLGALPEAPLAMPLQVIEGATPGFFASRRGLGAQAPKAGH